MAEEEDSEAIANWLRDGADLAAEHTKLREENTRLNTECEKLIRENAAMKRRLSDWE